LSDWFWASVLLPLCLAGWIAFSYLLSYLSGWRGLAAVYQARQPFLGKCLRPWAASMRWGVNYNGLLAIGVDSLGIHLSVFFLFRAGHPPLFIPFGEISTTLERAWWFETVKMRFENYPSTYLLVPLSVAEKLSEASGLQFQVEKAG
jgi:hypothetical protein